MNDELGMMNDIERRDLRKRTKLFALRIKDFGDFC